MIRLGKCVTGMNMRLEPGKCSREPKQEGPYNHETGCLGSLLGVDC